MNLAPIVLFTFNRPEHTAQTLDALSNNELAAESDLIVYLDGPRNDIDRVLVERVYQVVLGAKGFKSVVINRKVANVGLASNIIEGISNVIARYGKVIVVEDDLLTSPKFLAYMNDALEYYSSNKQVWHISGFTELIDINLPNESFFWRTMFCWGWATWNDRWFHFQKNPQALINTFTPEMIKRFNLDGHQNFWKQVKLNANGRINTWAIFWYATIFKNKGYCLNPFNSYVQNIGFDGSGVHCGEDGLRQKLIPLNQHGKFNPPKCLEEDKLAIKLIKNYYRVNKPSIFLRIYRALKRRLKNFLERLSRIR